MADSKLSGLPEATTVGSDDLLLVTVDPTTNPTSKRMSVQTLFENIPVSISVTGGVEATANSVFTGVTSSILKTTGDRVKVASSYTPANANGATGDTFGDVAWDSSYLYVCTATYTNGSNPIWKRAAISSW